MQSSMAIRIRRARQRAGLSQGAVAGQLEVNRSAVAQWEKVDGGTTPSVANLARLATVTRVTFEWLATGRGESEIDPRIAGDVQQLDDIETQCIEAVRRLPKRRREAICKLLLQLAG
jgi:transcriptional regulator with XRE-family HTH domain